MEPNQEPLCAGGYPVEVDALIRRLASGEARLYSWELPRKDNKETVKQLEAAGATWMTFILVNGRAHLVMERDPQSK